MKRFLVLLAACAPANDQIGETIYTVEDVTYASTFGAVGPGGHIAFESPFGIEFRGADDGAIRWQKTCGGNCGWNYAIDEDGNLYRVKGDPEGIHKLAAADGSVLWSRSIDGIDEGKLIREPGGAVWLLAKGKVPIDFGGGPVDGGMAGAWARFSPDGDYLASGTLEVALDFRKPMSVLQDRGPVGLTAFGKVVGFDREGRKLWDLERDVLDFAQHENGELTFVEQLPIVSRERDYEIVRLDVDREERWRRPGTGSSAITPIAGNGALVAGSAGLSAAISSDASFLEYFDTDGTSQREIVEAIGLRLFHGPPLDGFRFVVSGTINGRRLP